MNVLVGFVLLASLSAICGEALAGFSCSVFGSGAVEIETKGEIRTVPTGLDECEGARVRSGSVTACAIDSKGRAICRPFSQGESIAATRFVKGGGLRQALLVVQSIIQGDNSTDTAQSRGEVPPGFPSRRILLMEPVLRIDLKRSGLKSLTALKFREDGTKGTAVVAELRDSMASIDGGRLKRGRTYYIVVEPELIPKPIEVRIATTEEVENARSALERIDSDAQAGTMGRAILRAEWLMANNYVFDAARVLHGIGLSTNE